MIAVTVNECHTSAYKSRLFCHWTEQAAFVFSRVAPKRDRYILRVFFEG